MTIPYLITASGRSAANSAPVARCGPGQRVLLTVILAIVALPAAAAVRQRLSTTVLAVERSAPAEQILVGGQPVTEPPVDELYRARSANSRAETRFALLLPERPVTIGLRVWINGQRFADAREEAIKSLLRANAPDAESSVGDGLLSRFTEYVRVTGRTPSRDEIRWLMQKWELGPRVLELRTAFRASMRGRAPVFEVVDRDHNDVLTENEIALAARTLQSADSDRNAVLQRAEISRMSRRRPRVGWQSRRLLISLDEAEPELNETYSPEVVAALANRLQSDPDLVVSARFDTNDRAASTLEVTAPESISVRCRQAGAVELDIAGATLLISAAQSEVSQGIEPVSVGAAASSAALFDRLDSNHDGRLTIRELRQAAEIVATLDRNADGRIAAAELPELVHFGVGLGPIVHHYLGNFRSPGPYRSARPSSSWFDRMDRNRDGDLSWSEFLGDKDQFRALDVDADGLIGRNEAHRGQQSDK